MAVMTRPTDRTPSTDPSAASSTDRSGLRLGAAFDSLQGLSVGDALGAQFFVPANRPHLDRRQAPPGRWPWTDDTEMACSVHAALVERGRIDAFDLTHAFARRHDFDRGYGPAANRMLRLIREGGDARRLAAELFDGQGSYGNGAAMRVAPLGAAHADDPAAAVRPAADTAVITHTHPQAVDGAIAVAVAAALAARARIQDDRPAPADFLAEVRRLTPRGAVRDGLGEAIGLLGTADPHTAAKVLGNGSRVSAADTVPFALWAAARHLDDYPAAIWDTVTAGGDVDTTAAVVGGVVAARTGAAGIPAAWLAAREALPAWAAPAPGSVADTGPGPAGRTAVLLPRPVDLPELHWTDRDWQRIRTSRRDRTGALLTHTAEGVLHLRDGRSGHGVLDVRVEALPRTGWRPVEARHEAHPARSPHDPADLLAALRLL
ncbi:ADP-ribosylglycohydrolase [Streptomyces sp. TLI_235]|nr:ADP-ribosylglycohydrolase [Streptomyces sp. TLI_235]